MTTKAYLRAWLMESSRHLAGGGSVAQDLKVVQMSEMPTLAIITPINSSNASFSH